MAKRLAYSLGFFVRSQLARIRAMDEREAKAEGDRFLEGLARERDRIAKRHDEILAEKQVVERELAALGERLLELLQAKDDLAAAIPLSQELLALLGRTEEDGPVTQFEAGLDVDGQ